MPSLARLEKLWFKYLPRFRRACVARQPQRRYELPCLESKHSSELDISEVVYKDEEEEKYFKAFTIRKSYRKDELQQIILSMLYLACKSEFEIGL